MVKRYKDLFDLSGRVAVVTGALGILGRKFCEGLAEFGAHVAVLDLDPDQCERFAQQLAQKYGRASIGIGCDVSKPSQVRNMFDTVESRLGPVRIVLNNAASKTDDLRAFYAPIEKYSLTQWRRVTAVNIDGMFVVAREAGRRMIASNAKGSIVQTSSLYGWVAPDPSLYEGALYGGQAINTPAVYSTSKAAVHGLTRHLAAQWAAHGIRVNTLVPGGVEHEQNEVFKKNYAARTPLGRMGKAEEMVGAVLFLASDASAYMTGQSIIVDGGFSAW